jgi:integrase
VLPANPVEKLEKLQEPKTVGEEREKPFRDAEWKAILTAAKNVKVNAMRPYVSARNRWCPWILAHTAARISSITRLMKSDVRDEGGIWVIDLRQTKTGKARSIPLHPQLIEEGFLEYVDTVPDGAPLARPAGGNNGQKYPAPPQEPAAPPKSHPFQRRPDGSSGQARG